MVRSAPTSRGPRTMTTNRTRWACGVSGAAHDSEPRQPGDLSDTGQETAELDMRTVFDEMEDTTELVCEPFEPDRLRLERDSRPSGLFA